MRKIIIIITIGIILLLLGILYLIFVGREGSDNIYPTAQVENGKNASGDDVPIVNPIESQAEDGQIVITGEIIKVVKSKDAAMLQVKTFKGEVVNLGIDDSVTIDYSNLSGDQENIQSTAISYMDIKEGDKISANILPSSIRLEVQKYVGPVLVYE